jgi:uncharacterized membrane protein
LKRSTWVAIALLLALYTTLSLYSSSTPAAKGLGAALSVGPVLLIALIVLWRSLSTVLAAALTALLAALLYREWAVLERHYEWSDLVQQALIYALIATSFALSLRPARVPLCTQLAQKLHGTLDAREIAYLRRATAVWASFYALICAAIIVLFLTAPLRVWSLFVNVLVFAVIALACVADHLVRRRVLPPRASGGLMRTLKQALVG